MAVLCRVAGRDGEAAELFEGAAAAFESAGAAESRQAATLLVNFAAFERRLGRITAGCDSSTLEEIPC